MNEELKMIPELPQSITTLKDKIKAGAFQRGPERYGLTIGRFQNGNQYITERNQGIVETARNIMLGQGVLIVTRPAEEQNHETVVKIGSGVNIGDYVIIQAAAVPDRPAAIAADLLIHNSATLAEGVEIYNRNFHPLPEDKEEIRLFTAIQENITIGRYSIILVGSNVKTDIPPFSIVTLDKDGKTKIITDTKGFAEKHEPLLRKIKSGKPAIKPVSITKFGVTEHGTTFSISGDESKILLGKCNFVPDGPLLVAEGNGSIIIGKGSGDTTFINRRSQLWAIDHPIIIEDGVQIAWDVLITTSFENKNGPVVIGKNSWVGSNAIIYPGVTIGEGSIVAAGALVTENVPPYVLVAGRPATVKRKLTTTSAMRGKEARFD